MMKAHQKNTLISYIDAVPDPRCEGMCVHKFLDILIIAICAVLCGVETWEGMEKFGHKKKNWLSTFLELPHGIPSHDTFYRTFCLLDPANFEHCFTRWISDTFRHFSGDGLDVIPIDGKCLRGSRSKSKKAIHMVSAWSTRAGMVLCQRKVNEKSNEITAVPELLRSICLKGCFITADALNCQKEIVKVCIEQGGDYLLPVKGNQAKLYKQIEQMSEKQCQWQSDQSLCFNFSETIEKGHGRTERRMAWVMEGLTEITEASKWKGLQQVAMIQRDRQVGDKVTTEVHYYIMSQQISAAEVLDIARKHWEVENKLHWRLDVAFGEDHNQTTNSSAIENVSILNRIALNIHTQDTETHGSIKLKRLAAGWDNEHLERLIKSIVLV